MITRFSIFSIPWSVLGVIGAFACCGQVFFLLVSADRQIVRMRLAFYRNIIRQDMAWFDATSVGELTTRFTE